jgi:hypothetical protein
MDRRVLAAGVLGTTVGLGIFLAGLFLGQALFRARAADRYVTVKGFAEREMPADLAIWPVVFTVTADDLVTLQERLADSTGKVEGFLAAAGFERGDLTASAPRVTDRDAQGFREDARMARYVAEATVTLRTGEIDAARSAMERSGELVTQGVALIRSYEYNTQYLYTRLEEIKPEMIAQATQDARAAAQQFAADSGSSVGAIRNAQQGYFSIEDRDPFSPEFKKVRVVTTVQYFLVDG